MTILRAVRGVALALCAALGLAAVPLASAHPALATGCPDVLILGLRGAGDSLTDSNGMGADVLALANIVAGQVETYGYTVGLEGVPYAGVTGPQVLVPDQLLPAELTAQAYILNREQACPRSAIALFGQSEGAAVLHEVVDDFPSTVDVLLGDPLHQPLMPYNWSRPGNGGFGIAVFPWAVLGHSPAPISAWLWPQLRSYCLQWDPICGGGGADFSVHTGYRNDRQLVLTDCDGFNCTGMGDGAATFRAGPW